MIGFHQLQPSHIYIQVHLFLNAFVTGTERLDLRIGQSGFIDIVAGPHRRFGGHDLRDKLLLVLQGLPQIRIEGGLRHIAVNMNFGVHIALTDDTTGSLFQVARSPRRIEVMERDKPVLDIHTGTHFEGRTHEHSHLSGTDFGEEFLLTGFSVGLMNKGDLFPRDASGNELFADVIVHGEPGLFLNTVFLCKHFKSADLRTVEVACRSFGCSFGACGFRSGKVAEDKLRQLVLVTFLPNAVNVVHAHIDLTGRLVGQVGVDDTLIQAELASIRGDFQHVIDRSIHDTGMDFGCAFGQFLYHGLLNFSRLRHFVVVDRGRGRQVELIGGFDICRLFEQVHEFGQIKELRKASSRTVARALRCKLNGGCGLSESGGPTVEVCQTLVADGVVLQVTHHRVQLRHGVADGRSGSKHNATAVGQLVDIAALQEHVRGFLRIAGGKSCDISHLGIEEEVLETVRLVNIEPVNAELLKGDNIVLAAAVLQLFQTSFQALLCALQRLDREAFSAACSHFSNTVLNLCDLLLQKSLLPFLRYRDSFKLAVSDDDCVIVAGCDSAAELLAVSRLEVLFGSGEDICGGIQPEELACPLFGQVVRDNKKRLLAQAESLAFHSRRNHFKSFACTNFVCKECIAAVEDVGNRVFLMLTELDLGVHTAEYDMRAVVLSGTG